MRTEISWLLKKGAETNNALKRKKGQKNVPTQAPVSMLSTMPSILLANHIGDVFVQTACKVDH